MTDTVLDSLDERQSKAVVLLVLSKALASIDHSPLRLKLGSLLWPVMPEVGLRATFLGGVRLSASASIVAASSLEGV